MEREYFFKSDQLIIWRPTGQLNVEKIYDFIRYLDKVSEERDPHFYRFIDLSQISGISVKYDDLSPIAEQRKKYFESKLMKRVKMAFYVTNPLSRGMARMYQIISDENHLLINIYDELEKCAEFLEVNISMLTD